MCNVTDYDVIRAEMERGICRRAAQFVPSPEANAMWARLSCIVTVVRYALIKPPDRDAAGS